MPIRRWDGVDDRITLSIGGCDVVSGPMTALALVRPDDLGKWQHVLALVTSGGTVSTAFGIANNNHVFVDTNNSTSAQTAAVAVAAADEYAIIGFSTATGTAAVRLHYYRFSTTTWAHADASGTYAKGSSVAGGEVWLSGSDVYDGDQAAVVLLNTNLSVDADVEAFAAVSGLDEWGAHASAVGGWRLNQAATSTAVTDDTGNGADQTAITGTTVVAEDPPIPYAGASAIEGAALLAGVGSLSSVGSRIRGGVASLDGAGSVTADPTAIRGGRESLDGAGSVTARAVRRRYASATLTASAGVTAGAVRVRKASAALEGVGTFRGTAVSDDEDPSGGLGLTGVG